ncbi:hypothetical protein LB533_13840 [Mesorhizobium sp. BR1-1-13]|uniref:hypothetical protein n=1 Tax=Mesorhizobium sp. BR1-1-13 TaxID=2876656 RepID=UPI001CD06A2A|nr:hypothetical protein [Mesorhizobium sp. BR1-1-13]MBZ9942184.1 hypothetical protein [Mesorhizobium sp. BR1-1-13]
MNGVVNDILAEVAEMLPTHRPDEKDSLPRLPVDDPNFPNDLEPVIRANPYDIAASTRARKSWKEFR